MARRPTRTDKAARGVLPRRSIANHNFEHFKWFATSCELPDGLGKFEIQEHEEAMFRDYFAGIAENLWLLPTGQRKSMILGLLALHCATYVRSNARVFILGGLGGHGRNALDAAAGFVERDPNRLGRWWVLQEYGMGRLKSLIDRGTILVVSAGRRVGGRGGSSVEGENPDLILVEEFHRHEDDGAALGTLQSKAQKKSHGGWIVQTVIVTTAGDNLDSALGRKISRATDIDAGAIVTQDRPDEYYRRGVDADGDIVLHEWAVPEHIQPPQKADGTKADMQRFRKELAAYLEHVKRANPATFITVDNLRRSFKALSQEIWVFQRQHCNQWVVQTHPAIDRVGWGAGADPTHAIPAAAEGVVIGLDTSDSWDTTAITPAWRAEDGKVVTSGTVVLQPTGGTRPKRMREAIKVLETMLERWPGAVVAFDRHYGGGYVAEVLEEDHGITTVDVGMGAPFEMASALLAELVDQQQMQHNDDETLTAHVLAATAKRSRFGRRWRLWQPPDGRPIDACAALAIAVWIVFNPPEVPAQKAAPGADFW